MMMHNNPLQMVQQLKSNPVQFLIQRKLNIPESVASDPHAILNYLMQTGQVSQDQINSAYRTAQRFR